MVSEPARREANCYHRGMIRPAYLAGSWYPADAETCRAALDAHSRSATRLAAGTRRLGKAVAGRGGVAPGDGGAAAGLSPTPIRHHGLIGPHAGMAYSGDAAGRAYGRLARDHAGADLAVVFGSHRGPRGPNTVFRHDGWQTPLGVIQGATELADRLAAELELEDEPGRPTRPDNGVELHLPFVRHFFPGADLLMLGVAAAEIAIDIGDHVGALVRSQGRHAVFIGSTDLTHYGPNYDYSPRGAGTAAVSFVREENDRGFIDAVLDGDEAAALGHAIDHQSACCPGAAVAAMAAVRGGPDGSHPELVDHYLSYDIRRDESFVGYASILL